MAPYNPATPVTAVIFDLDGTLVDSQRAITASLRHVQRECGLACSIDQDLRWALGPPLKEIMSRLLDSTDDMEIGRAMAIYRAHNASVCLTQAAVYEGIPASLQQLNASGCRLFVATSKLAAVAHEVLDYFDLTRSFEGICGSEQDGRFSQKTESIAHLLRTHELKPSATVMVGDRAHDIIGARACGIRSVGVTYGYGSRQELEGAGPDVICEHPRELPSLLHLQHLSAFSG
jgi:phosphoglycolate phosphatase